MGELYAGTYVVYSNVKVRDFMVFWLEDEMRSRITSGSYEIYHNIVNNHVILAMGNIKMTEVKWSHIQNLYNEETAVSGSIARLVKTVMNTSMQYAVNKEIITIDVYGDTAEIIEDCLDDLQPFIDDVIPKEENDSGTDFSEDNYIEQISEFFA